MPNRHNDEQHLAARDRAKRAAYLSGRLGWARHRNATIAAELGVSESAIRHYPSRYPREWQAAYDRGWAEFEAEWRARYGGSG